VLGNMLGLNQETSSAEAELMLRTELKHYIPDQATEIYPYLAHLLEIHLDEEAAQRIKYLDGEGLHRQILQSVQNFIVARTKQTPLVLVWEDLHWADPSSLALLEALVPLTQQCALLLVLIYRQALDGRISIYRQKIDEIVGDAHKIVRLTPLSPTESGHMLDDLLGPDALPKKIRELIITKAEGNPFYVEEVIRSLINQEAITRSEDHQGWVAMSELHDITLPDTLQGVILARVDQLNPEMKHILQVASVVGRDFPYNILAQVLTRVVGG